MAGILTRLVAAETAAAVLEVAGVVHLFWATGGEAGKALAIPTRDGEPVLRPSGPLTAAVGVALLLSAALLYLVGGVWGNPPPPLARLGAAGLALLFLLRAIGDFRYVGMFKRVRGTAFSRWDSMLYVPLCFALALLIGRAAFGV